MAWKYKSGTAGKDIIRSSTSDDMLQGMGGDDTLVDGGRYGQKDIDFFNGGGGCDLIVARWGNDTLKGGDGNDVLVSRSDAGEPAIGQNTSLPKVNPNEPLGDANDVLNGGIGADKFTFLINFNARPEFIARHVGDNGDIDWEAVGMEGVSPHDHWLESIGIDTIQDFYRDEGDMIVIKAHSAVATIRYEDTTGDGRDDLSVITLRSDTGGTGAHHNDILGTIRVFGDLVTIADLQIDTEAHHGGVGNILDSLSWTNGVGTAGNDTLRTISANVTLRGWAGDDVIVDGGRKGESDRDTYIGGDGNDKIYSRWGTDILQGGNGDDLLVSRADGGEPEIAQNSTQNKLYPNEPFLTGNDTLTGGLGADTFFFRVDLNARQSIVAKHTDDEGHIHWHDVAGENGGVHLHWVETFGTDTITDFYRAEGDRIVIEGHTAQLENIRYADTNGDGRTDVSILTIRSEQGGSGSHDEDVIGTIKVFGNKVFWDDVEVNAGPAHGVADTIDDFAIL